MKRPAPPPRSGQDRWLVSYADVLTLLFALFMTLYAASSVEKPAAAATTTPDPGPSRDTVTVPDDTDPLRDRLSSRLEADLRLRRADLVRDGRGLVVSMPERASFEQGSAVVSDEAKAVIAKVVTEVAGDGYALRIEGHTDDVPIQTSRYRSNWELSTARAGAVVAFLVDSLRFPPDRLSAAGYAEFHPVVPNDSAVNRARNRRIDIVVLRASGAPGAQAR